MNRFFYSSQLSESLYKLRDIIDYSLQERIGPVDAMARFHARLCQQEGKDRPGSMERTKAEQDAARTGKRKQPHNLSSEQTGGNEGSPRPLPGITPGPAPDIDRSTPSGSAAPSPHLGYKRVKGR